MKECPSCHRPLRAGEGKDITKKKVKYRAIKLYCKTRGCPMNNGTPVAIDEVKV